MSELMDDARRFSVNRFEELTIYAEGYTDQSGGPEICAELMRQIPNRFRESGWELTNFRGWDEECGAPYITVIRALTEKEIEAQVLRKEDHEEWQMNRDVYFEEGRRREREAMRKALERISESSAIMFSKEIEAFK